MKPGHGARETPREAGAGTVLPSVTSCVVNISLINLGIRFVPPPNESANQLLSETSQCLLTALGQVHTLSVATTPSVPCRCLLTDATPTRHTPALGTSLSPPEHPVTLS